MAMAQHTKEEDGDVCTGTGEGQETFAAPKGGGAQAYNANGSVHKEEDAKVYTGTSEGREQFPTPNSRGAQADNANGHSSAHKRRRCRSMYMNRLRSRKLRSTKIQGSTS